MIGAGGFAGAHLKHLVLVMMSRWPRWSAVPVAVFKNSNSVLA